MENAARKDPYCVVCVSLDQKVASWARLRDQVQYLRLRSEPVPLAHEEGLQKAASALLAAEIHMCTLLESSNTNVSAGLAAGNIPGTIKALRAVNWLHGLPPPSRADLPTGWKPTAVPTTSPSQNSANLYELLPIDETDYEEVGSASLPTEDSEREPDPRAGKKRRGHKDTGNSTEVDLSCVDGTVLIQAIKAKR